MICAGNWKLNKSPKETESFLKKLLIAADQLDQSKFIVFPPALSLAKASEILNGSKINYGCQNISTVNSGAFTGETSVDHVKELNCDFVLIGHSERRSLFAETDDEVATKVRLTLDQGLKPMICIGETLKQREAGETKNILKSQLLASLEKVSSTESITVAYEPVWAIGTGKVAGPEQVNDVHNFLRDILIKKFDESFAAKTPLLYGGSVKPTNAAELAKVENVDGFLIGGASLQVESFIQIYRNSN